MLPALDEALRETIATKEDVNDLSNELSRIRLELKTDIADIKNELLKWYVGIAMFQTVTFIGGIIAIAKIFNS